MNGARPRSAGPSPRSYRARARPSRSWGRLGCALGLSLAFLAAGAVLLTLRHAGSPSQVVLDECGRVPADPSPCPPERRVERGDCAALRRLGRLEEGEVYLRQLLESQRFEDIEALMGELVSNRTRTRHGHSYAVAVLEETLAPALAREELRPHLDAWIEARPSSALARVFRARFLGLLAWEVRGGAPASRVPDQAWASMRASLVQMEEDLDTALLIAPGDLLASTVRLTHQRLLDASCSDMERLYEDVVAVDPDLFAAQDARMWFLMPKWGRTSSPDSAFDFARALTRCAPRGSLAPYLVIEAHDDEASRVARASTAEARRAYLGQDGNWKEISVALERLMRDYPESGWWPTVFARMARRAGKLDLADRLGREALARDPGLAFAHRGRGLFLERGIDDDDGALAAYDRALTLDPFDERALLYRAHILYRQHRDREAEEAYLRARTLDPNDLTVNTRLGRLAVERRDYRAIAERYSRAIEIDPSDATYYQARGWAYLMLGEYEWAVADNTTAIQLDPDFREAYVNRASALRRLGRQAESARDREAAARLAR